MAEEILLALAVLGEAADTTTKVIKALQTTKDFVESFQGKKNYDAALKVYVEKATQLIIAEIGAAELQGHIDTINAASSWWFLALLDIQSEERNGGITYRSVSLPNPNDPGSGRLSRIYREFGDYLVDLAVTKSWLESNRPKPKTLTMLLYYVLFYGLYYSMTFAYEAFWAAESGGYSSRFAKNLEGLSDTHAALDRRTAEYKSNRASKLVLKYSYEPGVPHSGVYVVSADSGADNLIPTLAGKTWDRFLASGDGTPGTVSEQLVEFEYQQKDFSRQVRSVFKQWTEAQVVAVPLFRAWFREKKELEHKEELASEQTIV